MKENKKTLQADILALMKEKTTELWTRDDVMETFKINKVAANNALYNLFRKGVIFRHKTADPETGAIRYAVSIKEENKTVWEMGESRGGKSSGKRSKRRDLITSKELRMLIVQQHKFLTNLEDTVCPALEALEEREKAIALIKNKL